MKKVIALILILIIGYGFYYAYRAIPIISGYGAKNLCSCVFVAGRSEESVRENELKVNPLLSAGTFSVNYEDSSATGDVYGMVKKKAIYRKGLGCTLVNGLSEEELRRQNYSLVSINEPLDTLNWPYGTSLKDTVFSNVNYDKLQAALNNAFVETNPDAKVNTRGVVVVYNGQIIGEKYAEGFNESTPQMGWSMTKSITATLLGMLVKDGKIDIYKPAPIDTWKNDARSKITTDQLLRMSSGLEWEEVYSGPSTAVSMLYEKADMGGFASSQSLENEPDSEWYYSSGTSNILSKIVRQTVVEEDYYNYIRTRLYEPLGMTTAVIEPDASGTYVGSSYMYASPRDWAKFGILYLNNGNWKGEQLLPENWAEYVSTATPNAPTAEYGAHFWRNGNSYVEDQYVYYPDAPSDLYSANGFEGQRVFIIPSKDMVIVRLGQTAKRGSFDFNKFLKEILESIN